MPVWSRSGMLNPEVAEPRDAWSGWIAPDNLTGLVWNTAPFIEALLPPVETGRPITLGDGPHGFLRILANWRNMLAPGHSREEQLQDYFALCLACHHATVATFVPTDVDSKIRGLIWREIRDPEALKPMLVLALQARSWSQHEISRRETRGVSGHNGEHWSVLAGALGRFLELGASAPADEALAAIEQEIDREQKVFDETAREPGAELDLLLVAMSIAHNRGDLTQGMSFWTKKTVTEPVRKHLSERGRFGLAVKVYQDTGMSAEGHRHYPLRPLKPLRQSADLLLPLPPFLDDWGARVGALRERADILEALVIGCRKVEGQQGYYRAIAGMESHDQKAFRAAAEIMGNAARKALRESEMRKKLEIPRASFEAMMRKRARTALAGAK